MKYAYVKTALPVALLKSRYAKQGIPAFITFTGCSFYVKLYIRIVLESNRLCKVYLIFIGI